MALTATLDKTTYTSGETMTLTVHRDTVPVTVNVSDAATQTATASAVITDAVTVADAARTWNLLSDDGTTALYTAVA